MLKKSLVTLLLVSIVMGNFCAFAMSPEEEPLELTVAQVKRMDNETLTPEQRLFIKGGHNFQMVNAELPYPFHHLSYVDPNVDGTVVKGIWDGKDRKWKFSQLIDLAQSHCFPPSPFDVQFDADGQFIGHPGYYISSFLIKFELQEIN